MSSFSQSLSSISLLILCLFGCSDQAQEKTAPLVVATSADHPPYEFIQPDGSIAGYDIDLAKEIAKRLKRELIIKNMPFDQVLIKVERAEVDMAISGLDLSVARKKRINFSTSYLPLEVSVVLYQKHDGFAQDNDLDGKVLGAQEGSTFEIVAQQLAARFSLTVEAIPDGKDLIKKLLDNEIDGVVINYVTARKLLLNNDNLNFFVIADGRSGYSIALPQNSHLVFDIDKIIADIRKEGILDDLWIKWIND